MRIFLTGATGYIGSAVIDALLRAGHQVTALVRNGEKAARIADRGAHPVVGDLASPPTYGPAAEGHHAYVHTALDSPGRGPDCDRVAIETLLAAAKQPAGRAAGESRLFVYTSGVWVLGAAREPVDETAPLDPTPFSAWRVPHEQIVLGASGDGLRTAVVRPGIVYGGTRGIIGDLFRDATNGLIRVVGGGENHWALVYDRDLADLYARLVVRPDACGVYHATDEGDARVNDLVEAIGSHTHVRPDVRHVPLDEARGKQGTYALALALDQVVRSPRARALGWTPTLHSAAGIVPRLFEEWRTGQAAS